MKASNGVTYTRREDGAHVFAAPGGFRFVDEHRAHVDLRPDEIERTARTVAAIAEAASGGAQAPRPGVSIGYRVREGV